VFAARARTAEIAMVDGRPEIVIAPLGHLSSVLRVTVDHGQITEFEVIADPARLKRINLGVPV
jgi:RNA polymerase sigma-70 factor (ECF subfamily)